MFGKKREKIEPAPGQESVWDYPRPPRLEAFSSKIEIIFEDVKIADTTSSYRVLETSHPPVYYLPPEDIQMQYLIAVEGSSFCEWKGVAKYYDLVFNEHCIQKAAWYYPQPTPDFEPITNYVAFYAGVMSACYVDGELVTPQPGGFYGGWITSNIVGPFKGEPGTWGW